MSFGIIKAGLVGISLFGMLLTLSRRASDDTIIGERYERFCVAATCIMVLTHSPYFAKAISDCYIAIGAFLPFGGLMLCIMLFFSELCIDLYKEDPKIPGHFTDFGKSFMTTFWIFLGDDWNSVMWDVQVATSYASTILFVCYVFASTMLFAQLVLGIIIGVYCEIAEFLSPRLYLALKPLYGALSDAEKQRMIKDFLAINTRLGPIHEKIEELRGLRHMDPLLISQISAFSDVAQSPSDDTKISIANLMVDEIPSVAGTGTRGICGPNCCPTWAAKPTSLITNPH